MGVHQTDEVYNQIKELLGIPSDEPIFIIRAQDKYSVEALGDYVGLVSVRTKIGEEHVEWFDNVREVGQKFVNWQRDNRDKVKVPD